MDDPAMILARYYHWITNTFEYYHKPAPCTPDEAKEAARRILKEGENSELSKL